MGMLHGLPKKLQNRGAIEKHLRGEKQVSFTSFTQKSMKVKF